MVLLLRRPDLVVPSDVIASDQDLSSLEYTPDWVYDRSQLGQRVSIDPRVAALLPADAELVHALHQTAYPAGESEDHEAHRDRDGVEDGDARVQCNAIVRQRIRYLAATRAEISPKHHVLAEVECHADGGRTEPVAEAGVGLQQSGDQRAEEPTQVDAKVEKP
jgi:hypothetical protein